MTPAIPNSLPASIDPVAVRVQPDAVAERVSGDRVPPEAHVRGEVGGARRRVREHERPRRRGRVLGGPRREGRRRGDDVGQAGRPIREEVAPVRRARRRREQGVQGLVELAVAVVLVQPHGDAAEADLAGVPQAVGVRVHPHEVPERDDPGGRPVAHIRAAVGLPRGEVEDRRPVVGLTDGEGLGKPAREAIRHLDVVARAGLDTGEEVAAVQVRGPRGHRRPEPVLQRHLDVGNPRLAGVLCRVEVGVEPHPPRDARAQTLGLATMFVTDAVRAIGNWVDVVEAVFVIDVIPEGSGLSTVASNGQRDGRAARTKATACRSGQELRRIADGERAERVT